MCARAKTRACAERLRGWAEAHALCRRRQPAASCELNVQRVEEQVKAFTKCDPDMSTSMKQLEQRVEQGVKAAAKQSVAEYMQQFQLEFLF